MAPGQRSAAAAAAAAAANAAAAASAAATAGRASCGIVGLPNVGKSTLFNALTRSQQAAASNYPFCTIDPNVARVAVPDARLDALARAANAQRVVPQTIELHDIAGLIKGASKGEGLGNKFLGNIRSVSMVTHVLRCFEDADVLHVSADDLGRSDPVADWHVVETELLLADLASVEKRMARGKTRKGSPEAQLLEHVHACLAEGVAPLEALAAAPEAAQELCVELRLNLLSCKPVLAVCNVDEAGAAEGNAMTRAVADLLAERGIAEPPVVVSAALEEEALTLFETDEERADYFAQYGLSDTGLSRITAAAARMLGVGTFYTAGEQEARAWTVPVPCTAQEAAGKIHSDIARGFIAAETVSAEDFIALGGDKAAKAAGKMRSEGREYIVQDGDVFNFKFNV